MRMNSWLSGLNLKLSRRRRVSRRSRHAYPVAAMVATVESLESRTLLSAVAWTGAASTMNWNDAANWSTNNSTTPGAADDVTIGNLGGATITVSGTGVAIHSLHTSGAIDVSGTSFSFSANSDVNAKLQIDNGGTMNVSGVTINGTGQIVNALGSTLTAQQVTFNAAVENDGTLLFANYGDSAVNGALTTGTGSTIELQAYVSILSVTVANGFTNHGLIDLNSAVGGSPDETKLDVTNGTLVNAGDGTIRSEDVSGGGGNPVFSGTLDNLSATLDNRGLLDLSGAGLTWNQSGPSTNAGTIRVTAGGLNINGGGLTNTGTIAVAAGRRLYIKANFTQTAGSTMLDGGAIATASPLQILGGVLKENGTTPAATEMMSRSPTRA